MIRLTIIVAITMSVAHAQYSFAFQAKVLSTTGGVNLLRSSQPRMARPRMGIRLGDRVQTLEHSGASLLVGTSVVYLEERTRVEIKNHNNVPRIVVHRGQVRVVVTRAPGVKVVTKNSQARMQHGILRVRVGGDCRIAALEGEATLSSLNGWQGVQLATYAPNDTHTLQPGQEVVVDEKGASLVPQPLRDDEQNDEEVESLQDRAANAAERQQQDRQRSDQQRDDDLRPATSTGGAAASQNNVTTSSVSASLVGFSASFAGSASGGLFADANQATNQGRLEAPFPGPPALLMEDPFPGNIHLITNESRYSLTSVELDPTERSAIFGGSSNGSVYFSIGKGALPTAQVFTDFLTASEATPTAIAIPGRSNYVLKFTQFGLPDAGIDPAGAEQNGIGITGLVGTNPPAPLVVNATPTIEDRGTPFNENVTFALGEFRLRPDGGPDGDEFELAIRRSDQDRLIVKDIGGNDAMDVVTPNPDVTFFDEADPRFLPAAPTVKKPFTPGFDPNTQDAQTRFSGLNSLRRAAVTTILADQLHDFARRTGQTRFVVDGRIIDVSGYRKP